jgi:hypothetical protein
MMDETIQTPGENSAGSPTAPSEHTGRLDAEAVAQAFNDSDREEVVETDNAQEAASGSEIPAPDADTDPNPPAMIPSHRLREETEKRREIEERYKPWDGIIQSLTEKGYTPDEIAQVLNQGADTGEEANASPYPATPEAPAAAADDADPDSDLELEFERSLRQRGLDPYALDEATLLLYRDNWETRRLVEQSQAKAQAEAEQARHAAETAAWSNRWEADVEAVKAKFPDLPQLQDVDGSLDLIAAYTRRHGTTPNREQFQAFVDRNYVQPLQSRIAQATQAYAAAKREDAAVPSVAGGSSPAPVDRVDIHSMKPSDQDRAMTEAARHAFAQR